MLFVRFEFSGWQRERKLLTTVLGCGLNVALRRVFCCKSMFKHSKSVLLGSTASHLFRNSCSGCSKDQSRAFQSSGALKMASTSLSLFKYVCKIRKINIYSLQKSILMILTSQSRSKIFKCGFKIHQEKSSVRKPLPALLDFRAIFF